MSGDPKMIKLLAPLLEKYGPQENEKLDFTLTIDRINHSRNVPIEVPAKPADIFSKRRLYSEQLTY